MYEDMTTISDFDRLRLLVPHDVLQINDGTTPQEEAIEITNPAVWL